MSCRCNEITKCEDDIALIEGIITYALKNARANNYNTMARSSGLNRSLQNAVFIENLERITQRFDMIKTKCDGNIDNIQSKQSYELSRITSRCERYIDEDNRYHERWG
jgi:hypothetical protein